MKITKQEIRTLIKEELGALMAEEVYGNLAIVYHGSKASPKDFSSYVNDNNFVAGAGAGGMYGAGLYTVYDKDLSSNTFNGKYGQRVYKIKQNLNGFIIFDLEVCRKVYGESLSPYEQMKRIGLETEANRIIKTSEDIKALMMQKPDPDTYFTSKRAHRVSRLLNQHVKGIIFTGRNDGKVVAIFDVRDSKVIAWDYAGPNKKKVEWKTLGIQKTKQDLGKTISIKRGQTGLKALAERFLSNPEEYKRKMPLLKSKGVFNVVAKEMKQILGNLVRDGFQVPTEFLVDAYEAWANNGSNGSQGRKYYGFFKPSVVNQFVKFFLKDLSQQSKLKYFTSNPSETYKMLKGKYKLEESEVQEISNQILNSIVDEYWDFADSGEEQHFGTKQPIYDLLKVAGDSLEPEKQKLLKALGGARYEAQ